MGKPNQDSDRNSQVGTATESLAKGQESAQIPESRSVGILEKGLEDSSDLGGLILAGVRDGVVGAISLGQANLIMNGVGKIMGLAKLEIVANVSRRSVDNQSIQPKPEKKAASIEASNRRAFRPFALPGAA